MVKVVAVKMGLHIESKEAIAYIREIIVAQDRILLCDHTKRVIAVLVNDPQYLRENSGIAILSDALSQIHSATSTRSATASAEDAGKTQPI
jgi:hypothetical protein